MLKVLTTIRDLHGIEFKNPVVVINHLNCHSTVRKDSQASATDPMNGTRIYSESREFQLSFNAVLYVNEQALEQGFKPLSLKDPTGVEWFSVPLDTDPSLASEAELVARCEQFVSEFIIPKLEIKDV